MIITTCVAVFAGCVTTTIGGWDLSLEVLSILVLVDYITGIAAAYKAKELRSSIGYIGLMKKASIYLVIILANQMDRLTNNPSFFRTSTAFFFIANEGMSILENIAEFGVKLPDFLLKHLKKLREKQEEQHDDHDEGSGE